MLQSLLEQLFLRMDMAEVSWSIRLRILAQTLLDRSLSGAQDVVSRMETIIGRLQDIGPIVATLQEIIVVVGSNTASTPFWLLLLRLAPRCVGEELREWVCERFRSHCVNRAVLAAAQQCFASLSEGSTLAEVLREYEEIYEDETGCGDGLRDVSHDISHDISHDSSHDSSHSDIQSHDDISHNDILSSHPPTFPQHSDDSFLDALHCDTRRKRGGSLGSDTPQPKRPALPALRGPHSIVGPPKQPHAGGHARARAVGEHGSHRLRLPQRQRRRHAALTPQPARLRASLPPSPRALPAEPRALPVSLRPSSHPRDLLGLLLLAPPAGRSLDETLFMQQLCATLLALARDHSPFNAYYSARLCERVQRLLLQLLRSLAQESAPSLALPVLDTLLLVLCHHARAQHGDGFRGRVRSRSLADAAEVDRALRRLRGKTGGAVEAVRQVIVGESETVLGEDALGRYFAREFCSEKRETLRLSRMLTQIEGGGEEGGRAVEYSQKDAAAIAEDVFDYVIGNGVDDECVDLSVGELLEKMEGMSSSQRAFLLFALQYITAMSPDAWNLFAVSMQYSAESWKKEGEKCRGCLDLLNALLSITVDRKEVAMLEELKNLICTL